MSLDKVDFNAMNMPLKNNYFTTDTYMDAYTDVGGTTPWMGEVETSLDAYMDVGGRAN